jgi:hypothetical protein
MTWPELSKYLARPIVGDLKDSGGAWSPALYRDDVRRKSNLVAVSALVIDVDEGGDVERIAELLTRYRAVVHSTFSSTPAAPRCRIVLALAEPIDAATYSQTHTVVRRHLAQCGVCADEGAKDPSRLSYAPVIRPGRGYDFRTVEGALLDARAVLAAQPSPRADLRARAALAPTDSYVRSALQRAASAVASADPGGRHYTLCRESFALGRLGLPEGTIVDSLLAAFVASAGEGRRVEGLRTIRDAVRARRGAA